MPKFIPGLKLSEMFYQEAIKPILDTEFPDLVYSAALLGSGSEVLGYDTPMSTNHHWGPKCWLFLKDNNYGKYSDDIKDVLSKKLPYEFKGFSTNFGPPDSIGVQHLVKITSGPINHLVYVNTIKKYFQTQLGIDPYGEIQILDWLAFSEQKLLEITSGKVFNDGLNELNIIRNKFVYYPPSIWLYLLASQWTRISQDEAFVGRCADVGDEIGSQIVASRLVREIMRLCFLMEKKYAPYTKWFGSAFSTLNTAIFLSPILRQVLISQSWKEREYNLLKAYEIVVEKHNNLDITDHLDIRVSNYYDRPYKVINAERFAKAIRMQINDEVIKAIPLTIGSVNQFIDCTDILSRPLLCRKLRPLLQQ